MTTRTHRLNLPFELLGVVVAPALLFYVGEYVARGHGNPRFFAFAIAGIAVLRIHAAIVPGLQRLQVDLASGAFEILAGTPSAASSLFVGMVAFHMLRGCVAALLSVVVAVSLYGASIHTGVVALAATLVALVGAMVLFGSLAILILGAMMISRPAMAIASVTALTIPILAGAYFPISSLPEPLHALAVVLPFRLPVDLLREALLHGRFATAAAVQLVVSLPVAASLGLLTGWFGLDWARRKGTLRTE